MDVREKLVELLQDENNPVWRWFPNNMAMMQLVDYLISNGVTVQDWVPVKDRLPDEHESLFARYNGTNKWNNAMFTKISDCVIVCAEYENGVRIVKTANTVDGVWKVKNIFRQCKVTHWMPLPHPPKGE